MRCRATYLHDRHVHDGLHPLDAAHGRLGHGAREIDRSVRARGRKDRTRSVRVPRAARAARARLSVRRGGAPGEVSLARWGRGGRRKSAQMTGVGTRATRIHHGASFGEERSTTLQRNLFAVLAMSDEGVCPYEEKLLQLSASTAVHGLCLFASCEVDRRQLTRTHSARLGPVAPPTHHSHRAEPPKGLNVRPPRPVSFLAMRCLSESTPLCASRARESPIVARVVRAIGRG